MHCTKQPFRSAVTAKHCGTTQVINFIVYNNYIKLFNNDIEENEISYIYKNYAKVGNVEKRSDKEMPDEEFEASNIDIGVSIYANEEDASKVLLYTTKVFELDRVE